ncbi:hypothetical protein MACH17_18370 [Phaeobacter inhibens]|uniref:hypothetical protein n=1 Tax=Phaeobacter inhibens TaxID=221822 RepID=UPI002747BD06|nr:hypothetical protein [Phaeobacter inhibens]GLO70320.1 hypothetical protein MACH17_18370 [Phaeobacter inhibens]
MSRHSFDPKIAEKVGVNAAVVYQNIVFWAEHKMNNRNRKQDRECWHDGYWWTYNSRKAFSDQFSYLTADQIRTALEKLVSFGLLLKGNYNKAGFDRTNWYAPTVSSEWPVGEKSPMDRGSEPNPLGKNPQPIPDSKPDTKPDTKNARDRADDLFSAGNETDQQDETSKAKNDLADIDSAFDEFWGEIWPSHARKAGRADCLKVYRQACTGKHPKADKISPRALNEATKAYIASVRDPQYLKGPLPWLRQPGWEPFVRAGGQGFRWEDLSTAQQNALSDGRCPPSLMENGAPDEVASYWLSKFRKAAG